MVVAGQLGLRLPELPAVGLSDLAGSVQAALADPRAWLVRAGARAAELRQQLGESPHVDSRS
jgi:hypothetical protein